MTEHQFSFSIPVVKPATVQLAKEVIANVAASADAVMLATAIIDLNQNLEILLRDLEANGASLGNGPEAPQ